MDHKEVFLPQDILSNLTVIVANSLPFLDDLSELIMWDKPIELCRQIETNIRSVFSVILKARQDGNGRYFRNVSTNPLLSHVLLVRVYILLYYRHRDDELYKAVVFPELQQNIGVYGSKYLNEIHRKVNRVLEIDQLIEKNKQGKKENTDDIPKAEETFTKAVVEQMMQHNLTRIADFKKQLADQLQYVESFKKEISRLKQENEELRQKALTVIPVGQERWIDWLDDDVFDPRINAEKVASVLRDISSPHLTDNCRWYVIYRVLHKIHWLSEHFSQKSILKWANVHFGYEWKGKQQFKFSEVDDRIKRVADISDWDEHTMTTSQGQYYAELRDTLIERFVEILPNGKYIDRGEFIIGNSRINNGH